MKITNFQCNKLEQVGSTGLPSHRVTEAPALLIKHWEGRLPSLAIDEWELRHVGSAGARCLAMLSTVTACRSTGKPRGGVIFVGL